DAYGHGAVPIARALADAGVDGLCVATLDEALVLRSAGIGTPLRVLYPVPSDLIAEARRAGVTVSAGDGAWLPRLLTAAADGPAGLPALALELEVETGLGRGGFAPADLVDAAHRIGAAPGVRLSGLWTHLQAVEDGPRTADQLARFEAAVGTLEAAGISIPTRHVAASAGMLTSVPSLDGVRPGLTVYGLLPDELDRTAFEPGVVAAFRPVMSLHAQPVRVTDLAAGHGVGYGPTFVTERPSRIATLPVGYGDGYSRSLSNRAEALVRGQRVRLVGNVAMDAVMVDVSDVPGPPVGLDDEFVLIGSQGSERIGAEDVARWRATNSWEVVSQMAARLPRVYHAASAVVGLWTLGDRSA
ncbi:MAG: alanine racemase, partial [Candidatus Limnocylindrales bacterium]